MDKHILSFLAVILISSLFQSTLSQNIAAPCPTPWDGSGEACALPDCRCSSTDIPGDLAPKDTPQIVYLTFDNAITVTNYPLYEDILFNRKNPNNASISATFFASHEYNSYGLTHQLWRRGHEIALLSITRYSSTVYWKSINESMWTAEIVDQRDQMAYLARIPIQDIKGMRAPFLQTGGDVMYQALNGSLEWECSRPTWSYRKPGLWPYSNDYASIQDCQILPCPTAAFSSLWTVPMLDLLGTDFYPCTMVDSCSPSPLTADETFNLLRNNFWDQYNTTRAPFGIFTTAGWMMGPTPEFGERLQGYKLFLDWLGTLSDVYIVSISKALEWVRNPVPLSQINNFAPWKQEEVKPDECTFPRSCQYIPPTVPAERYMNACVERCPVNYPWIHNPMGL